MAPSLLDLPPELLVQTLNLLPIRTLLRFGQTCHYFHNLSNSSMHTLSLGIHTTRISAIISKLAATQYPPPKTLTSAFIPPAPSTSSSPDGSRRTSLDSDLFASDISDSDPHKVSVFIPDAQTFDYATLLSFHLSLTKSIVLRHGATLCHLDLSLWTLTVPLAKAIAELPALRALSIRTEDYLYTRTVPRRLLASQRIQEHAAWDLLSETAVWAPRITALRIEGGEMSTAQLARLLDNSRWCRELWLCKCGHVREDVWGWLAREWKGRGALRMLGVMRCGLRLDEAALEAIGRIRGLQVRLFAFSLFPCGVELELMRRAVFELARVSRCG